MEEPWAPHSAEVEGAVESDVANQKKFGLEKRYLPVAHLALAQPRARVAGEMVGAWGRFGCLGAQLANMAEVPEFALRTNQEGSAKLAEEQNREWQQSGRGRHDVKQMERGRSSRDRRQKWNVVTQMQKRQMAVQQMERRDVNELENDNRSGAVTAEAAKRVMRCPSDGGPTERVQGAD